MELISTLIEVALLQCAYLGVINWMPGTNEPDSFIAECEIEASHNSLSPGQPVDYFVTLCGVFCIIDTEHLECWHASLIGG